jgi:20S proteasome alpha/beta subunit
VVVLAASQRASAPALIRSVEPKGVLTIGDGEGMGQAGLVIGVYVDGDRIRFDANTAAAARAGLSLSSHLLRLARIVG